MKKSFINITLASLFILLLCLNVFASPSPETVGLVAEILTATDGNGNAINIELILLPADATIIAEAMKAETIKTAMGDKYTEDLIVIDVREVTVPAGTVFPIKITFRIIGVTAANKGGFLHKTDSAWEWIDAEFGTDTMTGIFYSLSPVALVLNVNATLVWQNEVGTSPQTSDYMTAAFTVCAISIMVALLFSKKRIKA